ncbi:interleukin-18 receptor accessory protein [Rhinatrema bivittatum]|uniref:interleukin-18 receptor accessory protein n=1 Tax=Rhinatrema bivittatum TaxID=194408 RepID=UPI00112CE34F|nr:interleukin-18 receptor accessory protein [Rhinatrema bivittatum]
MKRKLLTTHWIFLLAIAEAMSRDSALTGCLHEKPRLRYRARSEEQFYLQCDSPHPPFQNSVHFFNHSSVKWFRQQENETLLELENSSKDSNTLWFLPARINDSGTYICTWQENDCVKIILEVHGKEKANCSDYGESNIYIVVGTGKSIFCPAVNCDNDLQRSAEKITWYKDEKAFVMSSPRVEVKPNKIEFFRIDKHDTGTYACDYVQCDNTSLCDITNKWIMRAVLKVIVIAENTKHTPTILDPQKDTTMEVELGKPHEISCKVSFGFEINYSPRIKWLSTIRESKGGRLEQKSKRVQSKQLYGETYLHVAKLNEVTEEDLRDIFTCHAQNSVGNSTVALKLEQKKTDRMYFIYILCITVVLLLAVLSGSGFVYIYWIEIVLLCQNYFSKDETLGDLKEFDAFVSYAKHGSLNSNDKEEESYCEEEKFAVQHLPEVLENIYGYKLCLLERDILPGGAYVEEIVKCIKRSRRAIFILSPRYINGPSVFELETAINCTIEDNKLKLILIKYKPFQELESLTPIVKKALSVLPVVSWKGKTVTSTSPSSKFWNNIRYHMPVKKTKSRTKRSKALV